MLQLVSVVCVPPFLSPLLLQWFEAGLSAEPGSKEEGEGDRSGVPEPPLLLTLLATSLITHLDMAPCHQLEALLPRLLRLTEMAGRACAINIPVEQLSHLPLPTPWTLGKVVETVHPIPDHYKFEETVTFPGAKKLFLKFDDRCSTQYDYDKVRRERWG